MDSSEEIGDDKCVGVRVELVGRICGVGKGERVWEVGYGLVEIVLGVSDVVRDLFFWELRRRCGISRVKEFLGVVLVWGGSRRKWR